MANKNRVLVVGALLAVALVVLVLAVVIIPTAVVTSQDTTQDSSTISDTTVDLSAVTQDSSPVSDTAPPETDSFRLEINPLDPTIISVETSDGETIYMLGDKTSDGLPTSISEFRVDTEDGSTYVTMGSDGSVSSAVNTDGLQLDFIWGENFTTLHASLVFENGTEQLSTNIDLSELSDDNFTDFEDTNIRKRSVKTGSPISINVREVSKEHGAVHSRTERQSEDLSFASAAVSIQSCEMPEPDARVFADVLLDYDESTSGSSGSMRYTGVKTQVPGQYLVRIPASAPSGDGDNVGMICDKIESILANVCRAYLQVDESVRQSLTDEAADSLICFALENGLRAAFDFSASKIAPVYNFCKTAFSGQKTYCTDNENTPAMLPCDSLPQVDSGIDLMQQEVLFTPYAVFPQGNTVTAQGRVLRLSPGSSTEFNIEDDQNRVSLHLIQLLLKNML
jgi:hypothetical protein